MSSASVGFGPPPPGVDRRFRAYNYVKVAGKIKINEMPRLEGL